MNFQYLITVTKIWRLNSISYAENFIIKEAIYINVIQQGTFIESKYLEKELLIIWI